MDNNIFNGIANKFWTDGYIHIKSVFNKNEMKSLKKELLRFSDSSSKNKDLMLESKINKYLLDNRIVNIVKKILGDNPVYFGDISYTIYEKHNGVGQYHKDCTDRLDPNAPDWKGEYPLIRVGFFLQEHKIQGGGVLLGKYSHNKLFKNNLLQTIYEEIYGFLSGNFKYIDSELGDIVIWNLRTTHGPLGKYIKYFFKKPVSRRLNWILPAFLKKSYVGKRILIQTTYGKESNHLSRYINYLKTRKYMVDRWKYNRYPNKIKKLFKDKNIILYELQDEIKRNLESGSIKPREKWTPFPY